MGAALRRRHGLSAEAKVLGLSSRVRRAAPSLLMPSEEPVAASHRPTKTAELTVLLVLVVQHGGDYDVDALGLDDGALAQRVTLG